MFASSHTPNWTTFVWDSINTPISSDILQGPAIATMTNASGSNNLVWFLPAINDEGHNHNILDIENNYPWLNNGHQHSEMG